MRQETIPSGEAHAVRHRRVVTVLAFALAMLAIAAFALFPSVALAKKATKQSRPMVIRALSPYYGEAELIIRAAKNAKGYEYALSTNGSFTKNVVTKRSGRTRYTFLSLQQGQKYYLRARAYSKSKGKVLWSKWTKAKAVTTRVGSSGASDIEQAETQQVAAPTQAKWVMIGDSYATIKAKGHSIKQGWPDRLQKKLQLTASQVVKIRAGGLGFVGAKKKSWLLYINKLKADDSVTNVLIVGGAANDMTWSKAKAKKWYRRVVKAIRAKFPNARIAHAITSWDFNSSWYRKTIVKRYDMYKSLAMECDVTYLSGCEDVLVKHRNWTKDGNHPSDKGAQAITNVLLKKLKTAGFC